MTNIIAEMIVATPTAFILESVTPVDESFINVPLYASLSTLITNRTMHPLHSPGA